jgi:hypothetical protein
MTWKSLRVVVACVAFLQLSTTPVIASAPPTTTRSSIAAAPAAGGTPSLAYYYIWYDATSWNRAKTDLPLAGKYSSDEQTVMLRQVQMAKRAGLRGFIVSWKSTDKLNRRLQQLADIAADNDFKLVVIYQGLDFNRNPLAENRVASDLDYFISHFSSQPAFQLFARPAVILSGSWGYSADQIQRLGKGRRDKILLLASEKNVKGVKRLAGLVDGDAYYWSSVDPDTFAKYQQKLDSMAETVHQAGGLWIAPAAPGFDARLVGGDKVVERNNGDTLRRQFQTAVTSKPDAVGIISWNEFSENSYVEPSRKYGTTYLDILADLLHGRSGVLADTADGFDSSSPGERGNGLEQWGALAMLGLVFVGATILIVRRQRSASIGAAHEPD